jgi:hypothetical protein
MIDLIDKTAAIEHLLDVIEENRLVVLCGAGLSMAPPSNLPSANAIALDVKNKCISSGHTVPDSLELQADHFIQNGRFSTYFLGRLISEDSFATKSNNGHEAIADFLLSRAVFAAVSTNVDFLIEAAGQGLFGHINGFLDGVEAANCPNDRSPLLKIHGCWTKDRNNTVWTPKQLDADPIKTRIEHSANWLNLNLRNKELLVVGFWSDWNYLNSVLSVALGAVHPSAITIIDPSETSALKQKAPELCAIGIGNNISFKHVQGCGATFLDELRNSFSRKFFRKAVNQGRNSFIHTTGLQYEESWLDLPAHTDSHSLHMIRRDIEGREPNEPARLSEPENNTLVGLTISQLQAKGAVLNGAYWQLGDKTVRVLRSAKLIHDIRKIFCSESSPLGAADIVICVGADDRNQPSNILREGTQTNVVRGGLSGKWLTSQQACEELDL